MAVPFELEYDGSTAQRLTREPDFDIELSVKTFLEKERVPETAFADWPELDKIIFTFIVFPTR